MTKPEAIKLACYEFNYKWPAYLFTGVMFYNGFRITIQEFNKVKEEFK